MPSTRGLEPNVTEAMTDDLGARGYRYLMTLTAGRFTRLETTT